MGFPYRIKINQGDFVFEVEGNKKFVLDLYKQIVSSSAKINVPHKKGQKVHN